MWKKILFLILVIAANPFYGQELTKAFPDDYVGVYKGKLQYETPKGMTQIPMEFHLKKTDTTHVYSYWLVYNGQPRKYGLKIKDKAKGLFEVDEYNGIVLPARFFDNTLYSWFEVQGNKVSSRLQFDNNTIHFEILFSNTKNKMTTGGSSEGIPQVLGYLISAVQKAVLERQD